jgi:uncharacterized Zn finger protein
MLADQLTEVLRSADTESFLFGVAHVSAGRVHDMGEQDSTLTGTVDDERRRDVRLGARGFSCPCPQGRAGGAACEHAVAVALAQLLSRADSDLTDVVAAWFGGTLPLHVATVLSPE